MISASALARQSLIIWPLRPELGEQDMHATQVTPDVTPAELVKRAEQMVPTLRARAAQCEADCKVADDTIRDFQEAGFFKILQPKRWEQILETRQKEGASLGLKFSFLNKWLQLMHQESIQRQLDMYRPDSSKTP